MAGYLDTPIEYLKGVGPQRAEQLKKELEVFTFYDLLHYYPFRYVDRSRFHKINEAREDMPYVQLKGRIKNVQTLGKPRSQRLVAILEDDTGEMELVWFKGIKWVAKTIAPNKEYIVFGKPTLFNRKFNIAHPELEDVVEQQKKITAVLQAVYPSTEKLKSKGLESKGIAKLTRTLIEGLQHRLTETLPASIIQQAKLLDRDAALRNIHVPQSEDLLKKAQLRLKFEELFYIQLQLLKQKSIRKKNYKGFPFSVVGDHFNAFYDQHLPFELTGAQKRVVKEIRKDMGSGKQMNRLLQGDVGSGKTLVALLNMLIAIDNGYQTCLMAPTEILANQHFQTLTELLEKMEVKLALLTGSSKSKERKVLHEALQAGEIDILIGTHALLEEVVQFKNLGLAVIDEQHRFGVQQRARLWKKNTSPPHVLIMTATPIPRTLAMTLYGDLDVSVIDELPPGRKEVVTTHRYDSHRLRVFGFLKEQIKEGRQVYIVYPLIKESEKMDYKDLMDGYESIVREFPMPEYHVSIVHGQMKAEDKDFEMQRFVKGETNIMVATTVIEVGVNVPNASVMVIESAERFGLSQLHQLRGRVGRGADQSYCILMTSHKLSKESKVRLETMVRSSDGFEISEVDLQLRGPGDITGLQQSGVLDLKLADLAKDAQILTFARDVAMDILEKDPDLTSSEHQILSEQLQLRFKGERNWSRIS